MERKMRGEHPYSRRLVVALLGAAGVGGVRSDASASIMCARSCETDEGPFFPPGAIPERSDLTGPGPPRGRRLIVAGEVRSSDCRPAEAGWVTSWQADANGSYAHPGAQNAVPLDANFRYFGRQRLNGGAYRLTTVLPAPYQFAGLDRAPHIHFVFDAGGKRLVTELYFDRPEDAERRRGDAVWNMRDPRTRDTMVAHLQTAASDAETLVCRYDITMPG